MIQNLHNIQTLSKYVIKLNAASSTIQSPTYFKNKLTEFNNESYKITSISFPISVSSDYMTSFDEDCNSNDTFTFLATQAN